MQTPPDEVSEIVTSSTMIDDPHLKEWQDMSGVDHTIGGPGEYEIGGVFITGVASHKQTETKQMTPDNVIYTINLDDVVICHLGECGTVPTQSQLEILGRINVLIIPVGIVDGLSPAMASDIVSMIEPDTVIPSHYALPGETAEIFVWSRTVTAKGTGGLFWSLTEFAQAVPAPTTSKKRTASKGRFLIWHHTC